MHYSFPAEWTKGHPFGSAYRERYTSKNGGTTMSQILSNLTSDQRRRYRKRAAALQLTDDRICDRLPDKEATVLSSDVEDRESVMDPYFLQTPLTGKRLRGDVTTDKVAVFGIEHLTVKTGKPLTIRGDHPVVIHTAKATMEPHAEIRIETPTHLSTQVFESDEKNPARIEITGEDGEPGKPGTNGPSASPGGAGKSGKPGGAAPLPVDIDLGTIRGPVSVIVQGGGGGNGGPGGKGGAPNGTGGTGGPGGNGGPSTIASLTYDNFQSHGYVEIWNLESPAGIGGKGGLGGDGKTTGNDAKDGNPGSRGSVSFGKKQPM
jgi:hypothetical protein